MKSEFNWLKSLNYFDGLYTWNLDIFYATNTGKFQVRRDGEALTGYCAISEREAILDAEYAIQKSSDIYREKLKTFKNI